MRVPGRPNPGCHLPARLADLAANLPPKLEPQVLGAWLHEPAKAFGVPTEIPQVRVPDRPHKFPTDTVAFRGTPRHSC
jgi:hypothetical protein